MRILKSIGAVLAGMITIVALSAGTDIILESLGIFTSPDKGFFTPWMVTLALLYRIVYAIAGGYIAAMLAPYRPMLHAIVLGLIGTLASIAGAVIAWDLSPHWFPIALIITSLPCVLLGSKLRLSKEVISTK